MKAVVLTGASGFIGRRLAARLHFERGEGKVQCLINKTEDSFGRSGVEFLQSRSIPSIEVDLRDGLGLQRIFGPPKFLRCSDGQRAASPMVEDVLSANRSGYCGKNIGYGAQKNGEQLQVDLEIGNRATPTLGERGKPKLLYHLAANTHTWERNHDCNDVGTKNLIRTLGPLGPNTHVVFTSTTAVMDNREDFKEPIQASPFIGRQPLSAYGQSKWRAEEFLRTEAALQGFRLSIVRLCTVYGPHPRPNTLFDVLKREVSSRTLASRLNWPGLTSFIHVDDVVSCLLTVGDNPPSSGETRTYLLATESKTLAQISRLLYRVQGLAYRVISLPRGAWSVLRKAHQLCRWGAGALPPRIYNGLWRFNMVVNPVFHCDTSLMPKWFPDLKPRLIAECVQEI
jgi:nucleoside-diphosphate-sugar epimerase